MPWIYLTVGLCGLLLDLATQITLRKRENIKHEVPIPMTSIPMLFHVLQNLFGLLVEFKVSMDFYLLIFSLSTLASILAEKFMIKVVEESNLVQKG